MKTRREVGETGGLWRWVTVMTIALAAMSASGLAWAASKPSMSVSWSPTSAVAGSTGNVLTVTFLATEKKDGTVTVKVPGATAGTPWSAPQRTNPSAAGFVTVQSLGCSAASLAGTSSDGTITINFKCAPRKAFALSYRATAATLAGPYTFQTLERIGRTFLPTTVQPAVTVGPGPLGQFTINGLVDAVAGTAQSATATAADAYGNAVSSYNGSAAISSSDPLAELPAPASFTNGARTFSVSLKTSGLQSVAATDGAATGSQSVTIAAGTAASLRLDGIGSSAVAGAAQTPTVTLLDQYANVATGYRGTVHFALTTPAPPVPNYDRNPPATSGDVPANHTFTETDAGTHVFSGLQLRTIGTWGLSVADIAAGGLSDSASQLVVPGPVTNFDLRFPSPWLPFAFPSLPGQGLCRLTPRDAEGNYVSSYRGTVSWTTTAASSNLPAEGAYIPFSGLITADNPYECLLLTPGTHELTATDVGDPSLTDTVEVQVLPPSPQPDRTTVQHPLAQGGVTVQVLDPLSNDPETDYRRAVLSLNSVGQAVYTSGGVTYQLGLATVDTAGQRVLWELNPPADTVPSVPGATLARCASGGAGCAIGDPISMTYTMTDTVSTASSSIDLKIAPPPANPLSLPGALNFAVTDQGIVTEDTIGMILPTANFVINGPLLFDPVTGLTDVPLGTAFPCQQDPDGTCALRTTATMSLPQLQVGERALNINLAQSLDVLGSQDYATFRSAQIYHTDTRGQALYGGMTGALVQVEHSQCTTDNSANDGQGSGAIVDCVQEPTGGVTGGEIAGLYGRNEVDVFFFLITRGYRVVTDPTGVCTNDFLQTGRVQSILGWGTTQGPVPYGTILVLRVYRWQIPAC